MSKRLAIARTRFAWRGWVLVAVGLPAVTLASCHARGTVSLATVLLVHVVLATATAAAGGVLPGSVALVAGFGLANWYRVSPQHQLAISRTDELVALVVYAVATGGLVLVTGRAAGALERARRTRATASTGSGVGATDLGMGSRHPPSAGTGASGDAGNVEDLEDVEDVEVTDADQPTGDSR